MMKKNIIEDNGYHGKEFFIKNIDMYITKEQILVWALHLFGNKYLKSSGIDRVDMEHYAEQNLKKEKIKMLNKNFEKESIQN